MAPCLIGHNIIIIPYWGRNKMAAISQTIFSDAFSWMKRFEFWFKFNWSFFLSVLSVYWRIYAPLRGISKLLQGYDKKLTGI